MSSSSEEILADWQLAIERMALAFGFISAFFILAVTAFVYLRRNFFPLHIRPVLITVALGLGYAFWYSFRHLRLLGVPCNIVSYVTWAAASFIIVLYNALVMHIVHLFSFQDKKLQLLMAGFANWSANKQDELTISKRRASRSFLLLVVGSTYGAVLLLWTVLYLSVGWNDIATNNESNIEKDSCSSTAVSIFSVVLVTYTIINMTYFKLKLKKMQLEDSLGVRFDFNIALAMSLLVFTVYTIGYLLGFTSIASLLLDFMCLFMYIMLIVRRLLQTIGQRDVKEVMNHQYPSSRMAYNAYGDDTSSSCTSGSNSSRGDEEKEIQSIELVFTRTNESFLNAMKYDRPFQLFKRFLEREFASENLLFYVEASDFGKGYQEGKESQPLTAMFIYIFDKYVDTIRAAAPLNLPHKLYKELLEIRVGDKEVTLHSFRNAVKHVVNVLVEDSWGRFILSKYCVEDQMVEMP